MSLDISKLLREGQGSNPQKALLAETRGLVNKWKGSGLLEGLEAERDVHGMAIMLENQSQQLISEVTRTNLGGTEGEQWAGVALPLVRRVFGEIAAKEFVSVQPMNLPSGLIFYMDFRYGTNKAPRTIGDSVYGDTTSSAAPAGGLYGAGKFGYSINDVTASFASGTVSSSAATSASVNWAINPAGLSQYFVPLASLSRADELAVRSFFPLQSGSNAVIAGLLPEYTKVVGSNVVFVATTGANITTVNYSVQPTDSTRGDFEDTAGSSIPPSGVNLDIPEVDLELISVPIVAKTRKLKAVWTPELAQDLNAYHSIDAEAELTSMLSEYISLEIDQEILDMLISQAQTVEYWSAKIGQVWNGSSFQSDSNLAAQAWTNMTWYQTLGQKIQKVSNRIHQLTMRGGANFVVVSPDVATILESIPGYTANTNGDQMKFAMGVSQIGSLQNRFTVYKNPYLTSNVVLLGFKGSNFLETGAVYAPYIPLIMTPLVYDPENFTPRRGVMTRYAKKMVRPEFFGKIIIDSLGQV